MDTSLDLDALKTRQQTAWASGDYSVIGTTLYELATLLLAYVTFGGTTALAAFGGGWKWRHSAQAAPQEHIAGWTWDGQAKHVH